MTKDPQLILRITGDQIPAKEFLKASRAFYELLDEVSETVSGRPGMVEWAASAGRGSIKITYSPKPCHPDSDPLLIAKAAADGLAQLERHGGRPPFFSDKALKKAKTIADIAKSPRIESTIFSYKIVGQKQNQVTMAKTAEHVDNILGPKTTDLGTLEGFLKTISIQNGPQLRLFLSLSGDEVRCQVDENLLNTAWEAMRSQHRVAVTGWISYKSTGKPASIKVQKLRTVDSSLAVPAQRVLGIFDRVDYGKEKAG